MRFCNSIEVISTLRDTRHICDAKKTQGKATGRSHHTAPTDTPPGTPAKVRVMQVEEPGIVKRAREETQTDRKEADAVGDYEGISTARVDDEGDFAPEWKSKDKDKFFNYLVRRINTHMQRLLLRLEWRLRWHPPHHYRDRKGNRR